MSLLSDRNCQYCSKPLKGRIDKKFCNDYCRNNHNNLRKAKSSHSPHARNINNALLKNRKILEAILTGGEGTIRASRDKLLRHGFQFKYLTHSFTNKEGKTYYYCYDYGYLSLSNDWFLIVREIED
jgi:hypothetical protein